MTASKNKAEAIAPLLEQAIEYRKKVYEFAEKIEDILAAGLSEDDQIKADWVIDHFISDCVLEKRDLTSVELAEELLAQFELEREKPS